MADTSFADYITDDLLNHIDGITRKRMFGGWGIYKDGVIFALITNENKLYFKVDEKNKPYYESLGSKPFTYKFPKNKNTVTMPYWHLPEDIFDDKDEIETWVQQSYEASVRSKKK